MSLTSLKERLQRISKKSEDTTFDISGKILNNPFWTELAKIILSNTALKFSSSQRTFGRDVDFLVMSVLVCS